MLLSDSHYAHFVNLDYLTDALGVGPEVLVGICVSRSLEMLVGHSLR